MATLNITAPDGKVLKIDVSSVDPANYDSVVDEVVADYMSSQGPKLQGDLTPSMENANVTDQGTETKSSIPSLVTGMGRMVEAGGAGLSELGVGELGAAKEIIAGKPFVESVQKPILSAGEAATDVLEDRKPKTFAGKAGKFVGSFFTPAQIAMQAAGVPVAKGVIKGLSKYGGKAVTGVGKLIARPATTAAEESVPVAQRATGEIISGLTGAEPEALTQVMAQGRKVVKGASSFPQLAEKMAGGMTKMESHIGDLNKAVEATLDSKKVLSSQPIVDAIEQAKQLAGTTGSAEAEAVISNLNKLQENIIKRYGKGMSEIDVHKWIQSIQGETRFPGATASESAINAAKKKVGGMVNDVLKESNQAYAKAKEPLANAIQLRDDLAKAMGVEREAGEAAWSAKDVATTKLRGLLSPENKAATIAKLKEMSKIPGMPNILKDLELAAAKESIEAPATGVHKMMGLGTRLPELGGIVAGLVPKAANLGLQLPVRRAMKYVPAGVNAAKQVYQGLKD